jgi:hypothetical protein
LAKIPVKEMIDMAKTHGPTVGKFLKDNWKETVAVVGVLGEASKYITNKNEAKKNSSKLHHRKNHYTQYKTIILKELDNKKRSELIQYEKEIEQFIKQIRAEEKKDLTVKKTIHSKRINNWNEILIQIKDKMDTKDYQEYLLIYNNPNYNSSYFEGFEGKIEKYKKLIENQNIEDLYNFISAKTRKSLTEIEKDFS